MAPAPEAPTPVWDALAHAQITQAPSADAFLLRRSGVQSCAASCIDSAVTEGTQCSVSDYACECQSLNALIIQASAYGCVMNACGVAVGVGVWSEAADYCSSVRASKVTLTGVSSTAKTTSDSPVVTVTETAANGQVTLRTTTAFVSIPTTESGGSGSTASGGITNTSQGSSLSTGAIVGIAIGAAAGAIIICAIAFLIYRRRRKQNAAPSAESTNLGAGPAPASAAAAAAPSHKPELDGKPGLAVHQQPQPDPSTRPAVSPSPSPVSHSTTLISHHPSVSSNLNPNVSPVSHHQHDPNNSQVYGYTPPPGVQELHAQQAWHTQQPTPPPGYHATHQGQGQPANVQQINTGTVTAPSHYEMGVMPPELQPNAAQFVPELAGGGGQHQHQGQQQGDYGPSQGYGRGGAYEMPGSHG